MSLTRQESAPIAGKSIFSAQTARHVRDMLELPVQPGGTAPRAQIAGYRVAGKTGTAHKLEGGSYADRYVAVFVGFAPVSDPRLVVAVMIDEPSAGQYYGGEVAAPVFAQVMAGSLRTLATHGVFRMDLDLDGEIVVKCVPHCGYLHRAVEKLCERLAYVQIAPIVDKNDYVSPMINEQAINMAFEKMLGIEVPRRARWMRSAFAELQRIASHLLWLGTFAMDLGGALGGGATAFMWCFREREMILDLFEEVTGSRFHYNTHSIGGNRHDLPAGWDKKVMEALDVIEKRISELTDKPVVLVINSGGQDHRWLAARR